MAPKMNKHSFLRDAEGAIASYNYTDIAEGTGVVVFNLVSVGTGSGSVTWALTTTNFYSDTTYTRFTGNTTLNFDLTPFNLPKTIKGTAYANLGVYAGGTLTSITIKVQKSSGGNVTDCSSAITVQIPSVNNKKMCLSAIPLTETNFKKGDFLRLNVVVVVSGSGEPELGHDPQGRDGSYLTAASTNPEVTTKSTLAIPFKLDL